MKRKPTKKSAKKRVKLLPVDLSHISWENPQDIYDANRHVGLHANFLTRGYTGGEADAENVIFLGYAHMPEVFKVERRGGLYVLTVKRKP